MVKKKKTIPNAPKEERFLKIFLIIFIIFNSFIGFFLVRMASQLGWDPVFVQVVSVYAIFFITIMTIALVVWIRLRKVSYLTRIKTVQLSDGEKYFIERTRSLIHPRILMLIILSCIWLTAFICFLGTQDSLYSIIASFLLPPVILLGCWIEESRYMIKVIDNIQETGK